MFTDVGAKRRVCRGWRPSKNQTSGQTRHANRLEIDWLSAKGLLLFDWHVILHGSKWDSNRVGPEVWFLLGIRPRWTRRFAPTIDLLQVSIAFFPLGRPLFDLHVAGLKLKTGAAESRELSLIIRLIQNLIYVYTKAVLISSFVGVLHFYLN